MRCRWLTDLIPLCCFAEGSAWQVTWLIFLHSFLQFFYFKTSLDVWDFSGSSVMKCMYVCVREMVRKRKKEWEFGRGVSRDSIRAAVYSGMTARYTVDREGDRERMRKWMNFTTNREEHMVMESTWSQHCPGGVKVCALALSSSCIVTG